MQTPMPVLLLLLLCAGWRFQCVLYISLQLLLAFKPRTVKRLD
jgi:hypothetical protein